MERYHEKLQRNEFYIASVYVRCTCPQCGTPEQAEDSDHWPTVSREFMSKTAAVLWAGREMKRNDLAIGAANVWRCVPADDMPERWPYVYSESEVWAV